MTFHFDGEVHISVDYQNASASLHIAFISAAADFNAALRPSAAMWSMRSSIHRHPPAIAISTSWMREYLSECEVMNCNMLWCVVECWLMLYPDGPEQQRASGGPDGIGGQIAPRAFTPHGEEVLDEFHSSAIGRSYKGRGGYRRCEVGA